MDLYNLLGQEKATAKATTSGVTTIEGTIKKGINEAVHNYLLENYPQYYKNLDQTIIVKNDADNGKAQVKEISGYHLLVPIGESVEVANGSNKVVMENAVRVASPQIYLQGVKNNVSEFVKIGGKTTIWNKKQGDFTATKEK
jgi:hypothetical protein